MILTYGNRHGSAAELAKELCESCGITVSYINVILMVDNWLPSFDMEQQRKIDKNVEGQLDVILHDLDARKKRIAKVTEDDPCRPQAIPPICRPSSIRCLAAPYTNYRELYRLRYLRKGLSVGFHSYGE